MYIDMLIAHLHAVCIVGALDLLQQIEVAGPVVLSLAPDPERILNGIGAVIADPGKNLLVLQNGGNLLRRSPQRRISRQLNV